MKLNFHNGLSDADKVLHRLRATLRSFKPDVEGRVCFLVESYVNCREQGYTITGGIYGTPDKNDTRDFYCAFSQYRNSDSVVVYIASKRSSNSFQSHDIFKGNIPADEVWRTAIHVSWEKDGSHYQHAADLIAASIKMFLSKNYANSQYFYA